MSRGLTRQIVGGGEWGRDMYGCICTFRNARGRHLTLHRYGPVRDGLLEMCAAAVRRDPTYRVVSYSTPQTIYGDLDGSRADFVDDDGRNLSKILPEQAVLAKVGLSHLCHPSLLANARPTEHRAAGKDRR